MTPPGAAEAPAEAPPGRSSRFLADEMLGKLARWMRLLGYDVAYARDVADAELRARAVAEDRILLTRDRECARLAPDPPGSVLVRSLEPEEQLDEVAAAVGLEARPEHVLTRCSVCNAVLREVGRERVAGRVPAGVEARHEAFWECKGCDRIYWEGSHTGAIRRRLESLGERPGVDDGEGGGARGGARPGSDR